MRHWGRWISAVIIVYFAAGLLYSFIKNPNVDLPTIQKYLFDPEVLRGVAVTLELTFVAMVIGIVGGTLLADHAAVGQPRAVELSRGSTSGSSAARRCSCRS